MVGHHLSVNPKSQLAFINRSYWPDTEATGQLLTELCEYLAPRWNVAAVVGQPNFKTDDVSYQSHGVETKNGVDIHRLQHSNAPKNAGLSRIRNLISFTAAVRAWGKSTGRQLLGPGSQRESIATAHRTPNALTKTQYPSTIVCETDPFLLPLVVSSIAARTRSRLVYYLQDIYPDVAVAVGVTKNSFPIRMLRNKLKAAYLRADRVIVLDEDMRDRLVGWGIPDAQIRIVPNWMDCSAVVPIKQENPFRKQFGLTDNFLVMHSGNMGMTQRLEILVGSMNREEIPPHVTLALVGNGAKRPALENQAQPSHNVRFFDYQPKDQLSASLSAADLHVVSMDQSITGCLAPSKLYGILASATPILAIVPKHNAVWRLVEEHQLGWNVEPGDQKGIAQAIAQAANTDRARLKAIGERGRRLAMTAYDKAICCDAFEQVLTSL
jgi:glycosyltransferase involved in cell wall biosynthesis